MNAITPKNKMLPSISDEDLLAIFLFHGHDLKKPGFEPAKITVGTNPELDFLGDGVSNIFRAVASNLIGQGARAPIYLSLAGINDETPTERNQKMTEDANAGIIRITITPNEDGKSVTMHAEPVSSVPEFRTATKPESPALETAAAAPQSPNGNGPS